MNKKEYIKPVFELIALQTESLMTLSQNTGAAEENSNITFGTSSMDFDSESEWSE